MSTVDRKRLGRLMAAEEADFEQRHPRSRELHERASRSLVGGVPMTWMVKWAGPFPIFLESAEGAHARDVDGIDYVDLCLGDTAAIAAHGPAAPIPPALRSL